ncbi:Aldehyde oxidoreductase molybdenum-binding subunit PaoC [Usitatibacter rugosus]|uniref:Aldehyde oxidoreductase molybdenum-binding subunit PaoC n=1 Tax=Usitatibacter rugosus TaxID=2732067 RepID=A0A6M4H2K0_9PROT|nr:xanthine dehydrogenase family protein molybdopterin-binding subunit [Usitatibacter rugosus]QJR12057.1 Aldehyde oxidoreductase molybdenum-binding subunit PaoC [Usitatibacter rugosus]
MKFETAATKNPIDQMKIVGQPVDRIDGPAKTTGTAPYAYERHDVVANQAYGCIVGSAIAKGKITSIDVSAAKAAPGVLAVVTYQNAGKLAKADSHTARLLAGPDVQHYDQAVAVVVAETFEQARSAAKLVRVRYDRQPGRYDLAHEVKNAKPPKPDEKDPKPPIQKLGDFDKAFAAAPVKLDQTYTTPDQSHAMMEPHASIAAWEGDKLTVWTANQMIDWAVRDLAKTFSIPKDRIRVVSPYVGGGFGAKLWIRSDALLAALGAKAAGRPVKVALARPQIANNTTHRPATIQHVRLATELDGRITAIAHESWSGNLPGGDPETAVDQTKLLYAGANRLTGMRLAVLDLPEGNAMRAPGEAPGLMALEIAMDEMAEKLGIDPIQFRILNDTQVDPMKPQRPFTQRRLVECMRIGADRFGWSRRNPTPGRVREGRLLIGMGMAAAFRNNLLMKSAARVRLDDRGFVIVETDMTDIGTGSYTVIAQTAAEVMEVPLDKVIVRLGDSSFPVSCGSGGQWGGNNACAGVYAACMKLKSQIAAGGERVAEDFIDYPKELAESQQQSTFGAHFVEVSVDGATSEIRVRRMLAVCAAGRILNPKSARSQVIGAMTMGVGAALMEELAVDTRPNYGFFVNHDLAGYEVPVHNDIPHQDVIFLDETDPLSSPMKAKGVGELGICGVSAAVANAIYNASGVRVRDYPITLDKILGKMSA